MIFCHFLEWGQSTGVNILLPPTEKSVKERTVSKTGLANAFFDYGRAAVVFSFPYNSNITVSQSIHFYGLIYMLYKLIVPFCVP